MTKLLIDQTEVASHEILDAIIVQRLLPTIAREIIIARETNKRALEGQKADKILSDFKDSEGIKNKIDMDEFLDKHNLTLNNLKTIIYRKDRIADFISEKWGNSADSLFIKYKQSFDQYKYQRIALTNKDIMQEVYFRIKEGEDTWENIYNQLKPDDGRSCSIVGPVGREQIEPPLLKRMLDRGKNKIIEPFKLGSMYVVAELVESQAIELTEENKQKMLEMHFEKWLEEEAKELISKIKISN